MKPDSLVLVEIRHVYGRELIYPVNAMASTWCALLQQKTFTRDQLKQLQILGCTVEFKQPEQPTLD